MSLSNKATMSIKEKRFIDNMKHISRTLYLKDMLKKALLCRLMEYTHYEKNNTLVL